MNIVQPYEGCPMSKPVGRPADLVREAWAMRFNITTERMKRDLSWSLLAQLSFCKSDEARRIILGVSEKENQ